MKKIKTIALVAPCGNIKDYSVVNQKIEFLSKYFKIKKFYNENTPPYLGYLSDIDVKRIEYFEKAFLDSEVDLVLNIRGGYGAIRIVDKINYEKIKNTDKIYCSSSDGTILLLALNKYTNIKCFHSLMLTNGFIEKLDKNLEIIKNNSFNLENITVLKKGGMDGILWGGNLSSIVSILGNDYFIPDKDIILFLEDLNEPLYKIDKMLYEIYRKKELKNKIKGIIFGDFYIKFNEILPLFNNYINLFDVPALYCPDITHKPDNITLPYGKFISLNI